MIHQHFFNVRLDFDVDGQRNSVYEVHTECRAGRPGQPFRQRVLRRSKAAADGGRVAAADRSAPRANWLVVNESVEERTWASRSAIDSCPGENVVPFAQDPDPHSNDGQASSYKHVWVTRYRRRRAVCGGRVSESAPGRRRACPNGGADDADRERGHRALVHVRPAPHSSPEDWPVMPVDYIGFMLKPFGFFDETRRSTSPRPCTPAHERGASRSRDARRAPVRVRTRRDPRKDHRGCRDALHAPSRAGPDDARGARGRGAPGAARAGSSPPTSTVSASRRSRSRPTMRSTSRSRLGLRVSWMMDARTGGAAGIDMLQHAVRAVEAGDASCIVLVAGDVFQAGRFPQLVDELQRRDARPPGADPVRRAERALRAGHAASHARATASRVRTTAGS